MKIAIIIMEVTPIGVSINREILMSKSKWQRHVQNVMVMVGLGFKQIHRNVLNAKVKAKYTNLKRDGIGLIFILVQGSANGVTALVRL